jgi:carbon-monoxide dehydrogenase large subunit
VVAVLTADDLANVKPLFATSRMKGYYATAIHALARDKVRYVGEPIVGIVAQSRYLAEDAAELIAIDFEPLTGVNDPLEAARQGAPLLHEEAGTNVLVAREFKRGDVDAAIAQAPVRVGGRFACAARPRCDRAARLPGRIRGRPRRAHLAFGQRRCPASSAMRWPRRSICRATGCASSRRMSAAGSAARVRSIRKRFSSARGAPARAAGQMVKRPLEDLSATSQAFDESSMPSSRSIATGHCWRSPPT